MTSRGGFHCNLYLVKIIFPGIRGNWGILREAEMYYCYVIGLTDSTLHHVMELEI